MKFLMMVRCSQADYEAMGGKGSAGSPAWSEQDMQAMFAFMGRLNEDLTKSGEMVDGQGLTEPAKARSVGLDENGKVVVTENPYEATEMVIAGYWVLECDSYDRATEIAGRVLECPVPEGTPIIPVHLRPIDAGPERAS
ncbi:hypothetical protein HUT18_24920 [Streptomyces sp. NA04227]|uniref:YciI family protein n=1 Tax=Streptomyces sp. NA04227 TaxID=2742136 RepID=UPI001590F6D5|nr:YciI family protein [Streptomyces sp. NA04227]QKW09141.1 hypothetical protein HUT18_24920 [Streptomyces sp. NA04227]